MRDRIAVAADRRDLTALILEIFHLNGALIAAGDQLVADLGLTSARWQVIGAVFASASGATIASVARTMGLTRQAVQRVANDLEGLGLVRFEPNPAHRRAYLVALTDKGVAVHAAAAARQTPWATRLASGLERQRLEDALAILRAVAARLDAEADAVSRVEENA